MKCPKCGSTNCQMTISNNTKVHTRHRGYGCLSGCCGWVLMGPVGLLCGLCGAGKSHSWTETTQDEFWVCQECGTMFTAKQAENTAVVPVRFYCDNPGDFAEYQENPLIKKFMAGYAEKWSMSPLGDNLLTRKNNNEMFEKYKNSCEADWFENVPIIFALEDQTSMILTTKDVIVGSVRLTLGNVKNIAVYDKTVYIESFCARFSSTEKAELFFKLLQELFENMEATFTKFDTYMDLLMYLQELPKSGSVNQEVHFSSQEEYASFVKGLAEQGLDKLKEERPKHFNNYVQAQEDKESLQNPAVLAFVIQVIAIFVIHLVYRGFLNALLFTVLWGTGLLIPLGIYITLVDSRFKKMAKEYLPSDMEKLIAENERNNIEKQGNILAREKERYSQLIGIYELKDIPDKASIKNKKAALYTVLIVLLILITGSRIIKFNLSKSSTSVSMARESATGQKNMDSERNETVAQTENDDSFESYVREGTRVKGDDLVNSPQQYHYGKIIISTSVVATAPAGLAEYTKTLENFSREDVDYLNRLPVWFSYDEFLGTYMMVYDDRYDMSEKVRTADSFDTYGIFIGLNKDQLPIILARYIKIKDGNDNYIDTTESVPHDTTPIQQPDNTSSQPSNPSPDISDPDYITGSSTQLGFNNVCNIPYLSADGTTKMFIEPDGSLAKFFKGDTLIYEGYPYRFDTLDNGGLWFTVVGINSNYNDIISLEWASLNDINTCEVDDDNNQIGGVYIRSDFSIPQQNQPETWEQSDKGYGYVIDGSDSRYLTKEELSGMSKAELRLGRNEIYARHGRIFKSADLNDYFNSMDWYYPTVPADQFDDGVLNKYEKQNLITIKEVEDSKTQ